MPASTRKQLDIRSDEAYATAHRLAELLGTTTTEVVAKAMREFEAKRRIPSRLVTLEEAATNLSQLMESIGRREHEKAGPLDSNHDDLYDEYGLPK
jgi:hypothetical protein